MLSITIYCCQIGVASICQELAGFFLCRLEVLDDFGNVILMAMIQPLAISSTITIPYMKNKNKKGANITTLLLWLNIGID